MSHVAWNRQTLPGSDSAAQAPDRSVTHYREAVWAARLALLTSIVAAGVAFVGIIASLVSLYYSLR